MLLLESLLLKVVVEYELLNSLLRLNLVDSSLILCELVGVLLQHLYACHSELGVDVFPERSGESFVGGINLNEVLFGELVILGWLFVGMEGFREHEITLSDLLLGGVLVDLELFVGVCLWNILFHPELNCINWLAHSLLSLCCMNSGYY